MLNRGAIYWATALGVGVAAGAGAAIWRYGDPFLQSIAPTQLVNGAQVAPNSPPPATPPAPTASSAPKAGGAAVAAPASQVASKAALTPAGSPPEEPATPPQFDIVRVEPTGEAVIAGRAAPKAKVAVTDYGRVVAETTADEAGEFTVLPPAFAPGGHSLGLTASVGGGKSIDSSAQVAVDVPQPAVKAASGQKIASQGTSAKPQSNAPSESAQRPRLAEATAQPIGAAGQNAATAPAPSASSSAAAKGQAAAPAPKTPAPSTAVAKNEQAVPAASAPAPVVVAKNEAPSAAAAAPASSSTVVAKNELAAPAPVTKSETPPAAPSPIAAAKNEAAAPAPAAKSETPPAAPAPTVVAKNEASAPAATAPAPRVVVGSVAAEDGGRLVATGAAAPNALLRLYLNGTFIANVTTGGDGRWSLTVEHGMKGGAYAVRADQIDPAKGSVIARAEVPFDYPERLAEQDAPSEKPAPAPSPAVSSAPKPPVAAAQPSSQTPSPFAPPSKAAVAAAEPLATPSAPAPTPSKPAAAAMEPEATPSTMAAPPKPSEANARPQPAPAPVVASPEPAVASREQPQSAPAEKPPPSQSEAPTNSAPPPAAASSQPEVAASGAAAPSSPAATPPASSGASQAALAAPASADAANAVVHSVDTKKVVRGDSLWRISSRFYGSGLRYKQIYEANASQMRDPWYIYPGQIFVLPRETPF
jgi:nucleoid-associated protein YgaU